MFRSIVAFVALAGVVLFVDSAKAGEYTYLQEARGEMYIATQILDSTNAGLHGHRDTAIRALKTAIIEVDTALRTVGITIYKEAPTIKDKGIDRLPACLKVMKQARERLSDAGSGFATHRMKAIRELDVAIRELEEGLAKKPPPRKAETTGAKK
jgi:hypothetical protein